MFKDKDDRHRATNSQSLWIDLSSQYNQWLVGIMVDFEVKGGEDPGQGVSYNLGGCIGYHRSSTLLLKKSVCVCFNISWCYTLFFIARKIENELKKLKKKDF